MDELAQIISRILKRLASDCEIGVTGKQLDKLAETYLKMEGVESFNKGYHPEWAQEAFPSVLCISPNGVVLHGIPNDYAFKNGDLITIDLGIIKNGLCGDAALTVPIGEISNADDRLLRHAKKAVYEYIDHIKPGVNTEDLANHMYYWANARGYRVNRRGAGHAIGAEMHMKPNLYNTPEKEHDYTELQEGMVMCVEPILTRSNDATGALLSDGWAVVTMDRKPAAMFEHMIRITKTGAEILTNHFELPT